MKTLSAANEAAAPPNLFQIAHTFFRIAALTFGSGNATTAKLGASLEKRGWLGRWQFDLCFALARTAPGTNLFAFCTAAAWYIGGMAGAVTALVASSVPAAVVVVLLTMAYEAWHAHPLGHAFIIGAMAAVVGLIVGSAWLVIRGSFTRRKAARTSTIVAGALLLSMAFGATPLV
ncbi:MAG: chromate transporter, partial [Acidobacteria bacterium]|nr:chromate transporter [Acidobacteriota bacterium]